MEPLEINTLETVSSEIIRKSPWILSIAQKLLLEKQMDMSRDSNCEIVVGVFWTLVQIDVTHLFFLFSPHSICEIMYFSTYVWCVCWSWELSTLLWFIGCWRHCQFGLTFLSNKKNESIFSNIIEFSILFLQTQSWLNYVAISLTVFIANSKVFIKTVFICSFF